MTWTISGMIPRTRTEQADQVFFDTLATTGNTQHACDAAGYSLRSIYTWRKADAQFAAEFASAKEASGDVLESEAVRRAVEGVDEPVFYKGDACGVIRRYSDSLLQTLLKGAKPETYRERVEHSVTEDTASLILAARKRSARA